MSARQYNHGHEVISDGSTWRYADTGELSDPSNPRPCPRCGSMPTPEGYDACMGYVPGAHSACCGHGVKPPSVRRWENGEWVELHGQDT